MITPTIILLLKAPRPNVVKTRLAVTIGPDQATAIYRQMVEKLLGILPREWPTQIHFNPIEAAEEMSNWLAPFTRPSLTFQPQSFGDLGAKLDQAFQHAFVQGASAVIALGGDCPALDTTTLLAAVQQLSTHDAVLGPAEDGGYYLLGLKSPQPDLFMNMPWSTSSVLPETRQRLKRLQLKTAELPTLADVDDEVSWQKAVAAGWLKPDSIVNNR